MMCYKDATGKRTFVTPNTNSVLRSVTRLSLEDIAEKFGWKIEERPIAFSEVEEGKFDEVAACGTAGKSYIFIFSMFFKLTVNFAL